MPGPAEIPDRGRVAGLVLARGGSASIRLKNVAPLGGRPLLHHALDALLDPAAGLDDVWVSTEHPRIAAEAASRAGVRVFARSARHARHDSPSIDAVREFLSATPEVDVLALVQCTSPFVEAAFVREAVDLVRSGGYDSAFSVTRSKLFRWSEKAENEATVALNFDPSRRPRRQDWSGDVVENGMFYVARRSLLLERGLFQGGRCTYVEVPKDSSLEIDTPMDLAVAESVLEKRNNAKKEAKKNKTVVVQSNDNELL